MIYNSKVIAATLQSLPHPCKLVVEYTPTFVGRLLRLQPKTVTYFGRESTWLMVNGACDYSCLPHATAIRNRKLRKLWVASCEHAKFVAMGPHGHILRTIASEFGRGTVDVNRNSTNRMAAIIYTGQSDTTVAIWRGRLKPFGNGMISLSLAKSSCTIEVRYLVASMFENSEYRFSKPLSSIDLSNPDMNPAKIAKLIKQQIKEQEHAVAV